MTVSKQQPTSETFNPKKRSPRSQQTERAYRNSLRIQVCEMLKVMNPQDEIHWRALSYEDLMVYARDWLQTEVEVIGASGVSPAAESPAESEGLALDPD